MSDIHDLRSRLVGERFFDRQQEEAFTVVGITNSPPLALLQYDDGVAWDEGVSNFTVSESVASQAGLEEHGLDSDRYYALESGPRIDRICNADKHDWYPKPDELWPESVLEEVHKHVSAPTRDFYNRIARCKRCGLSGDVAAQFGMYGSNSADYHSPPWFCTNCLEVATSNNLVYHHDQPYCPECASELRDKAE